MEELKDKYKIILSERLLNKNFLGIDDVLSKVKGAVQGLIPKSKPRMNITRSNNPNYKAAGDMRYAREKLINIARSEIPLGSKEYVVTPSAKEVESAKSHIDRLSPGGYDDQIALHNRLVGPESQIAGAYRDEYIADMQRERRVELDRLGKGLISSNRGKPKPFFPKK